ncbi:MAG: hypothetical protein RRY47_06760 [Oscillospiraceae bacterium]
MKKLLALSLALAMVLSLGACGKKVDKTAMVDAFNAVSTEFDAASKLVNDNEALIDEATHNAFMDTAAQLADIKAEVESDDLSQEQVDEITGILTGMLDGVKMMKTGVEQIIAGGGTADSGEATELSPEQLGMMTGAYEELAPLCEQATQLFDANGWSADADMSASVQLALGTLATLKNSIDDPASFASAGMSFDEFITVAKNVVDTMPAMIEAMGVAYAA